MNDAVQKEILDNLNIPHFKEVLDAFISKIQTKIDQDPFYQGQADELMEILSRVKKAFAKVNKKGDMTLTQFKKIYPDFLDYIKASMMVTKSEAQEDQVFDEDDDYEDDEDYDDLDDLEDYEMGRLLEEIDVKEFKMELVDSKNIMLDMFGLDKDLNPEDKAIKHEIIQSIENLQVAFADVNSIDELNENQRALIRPDFDLYIKHMDLLIESFYEDMDDDLFDEEFEDEDFEEDDDSLN